MNRLLAIGHLCRGMKSEDLAAEDVATVFSVKPVPRINDFFEIIDLILD